MPSWTTDIRHLPTDNVEATKPSARARVVFMREVVEAGTSRPWEKSAWLTAVRCPARVSRRKCGSRVRVLRAAEDSVEWTCSGCGDHGVVHGFAGTELDLGQFEPQDERVMWGFEEADRGFLVKATTSIPELRAIVARASPAEDDPELLLVEASVEELDEMYSLVEALMDSVSRAKIDALDAMLASLSSSIDGI
jgi:hypothetical protein